MKKEVISELLNKFEDACYIISGIECWSARELQLILGYTRWENFVNALNKAKKAAENASSDVQDHFRDITKMIAPLGLIADQEPDERDVTQNAALQ